MRIAVIEIYPSGETDRLSVTIVWRATNRMGWAEHEERLTLRPGVTLAQIREGLLADAESETENA